MHRDADPPAEPEPPGLGLDRGRWWWREFAVALPLLAIAWGSGASLAVAALVAAAVLLAMAIERAAVCAEAGRRLVVAARSARAEGCRDALAQTLSLELAHERSRSVLEALREGVLVVDGSGEIVLANPAARRAMRTPVREPAGQMLWEALSPELAVRAREAWQALREVPRSDDELPQIRYAGIPCRDCVFDLTAVEATSSRTGQDFGSVFLLVDTTRNFEVQRLKDRFLSNLSHELRTPLTNICAYAELLHGMQPGDAAEWPEFVRVIHEEGLQLSSLVDLMFDYLQLESGEAKFASEPVDGQEIVRRVVADFGPAVARRGLCLSLSVADDTPPLVADRQRVEQIVRNLLDNAVKFTPEHGQVRVSLGGRDEGWELRIEDSGPGVPPSDRGAVFEKFSQLRDHLTEKLPGAGLGLATSRAIVACLGGLIWCEDSPLGGAAFVVLLPGVGQPRLAAIGAGTGAGGGF